MMCDESVYSRTTTIGNPAGEVLTQLSAALGRTVSFVGATQASVFDTLASNSPTQDDVERAHAAKRNNERDFMSRPNVIGVGVGGAEDGSGDSAIVVYVDRTAGRSPDLPARVDNIKVRLVFTEPFVAY